jgi:DNA-binding NarL/FixJ family response regulator
LTKPLLINIAAVAECQAKGMTQKGTAQVLGISLAGVQKYWRRSNCLGRPSYANEVRELLNEGKTDKEIAQALGISISTANRQRHAVIKRN